MAASGEAPPEMAQATEPTAEPPAQPEATPEAGSGDEGAVFDLDGEDWGGAPDGAEQVVSNSAGDDLTLDSGREPATPAIDLSVAEGFFDLDTPTAGQTSGDPADEASLGDEAPAGKAVEDFDRDGPAEPSPDVTGDGALPQPVAEHQADPDGPAGEETGVVPPGEPGADEVPPADGTDTTGSTLADLPEEPAAEVPGELENAAATGPAIELAADIADGERQEPDIFAGVPGLFDEAAPVPRDGGDGEGATPTLAAEADADTGAAGDGQGEPADDATAPATRTGPSASRATDDQLPPAGGSLAGTLFRLLVALLLLVTLVGQGAYYWRDQLAKRPVLRPWVERLCALAGCQVAPRRDLAQLRIIARQVRSHPVYRDALVVEATLVNRAGFPQPYPDLQIRFFDANGQPVAGRVFNPREYLRGPLVDQALLVSDVPVRAHLELKDPGPSAVEYRFEFR